MECKRRGFSENAENLRMVLEDVIQLIRFPQMSASDFSLKVAPSKILNYDELLSAFQYLSVREGDRERVISEMKIFKAEPQIISS